MQEIASYNCYNEFVFRIPVFPFDHLKKILEDESQILNLISDPLYEEAIFLSSPELLIKLRKLLMRDKHILEETEDLKQTMYKFLARMSTRCTPFGLFAGCGIGHLGERSEIQILESKLHKRHSRLDMNLLSKLSNTLIKDTSIRYNLVYYPNSSLYVLGNKIRYIESFDQNISLTYKIVEVKKSRLLLSLIKFTEGGKSFNEIVRFLIRKDIPNAVSKDYTNKLIDNQILCSEIQLNVTGQEYLKRLIEVLKKRSINKSMLVLLETVNQHLERLDLNLVNDLTSYNNVIECLKKFNFEFSSKHVFQTDMYINSTESMLNIRLKDSIISAVSVYMKIARIERQSNL
jgi:lantibiotic biosynthesis protein